MKDVIEGLEKMKGEVVDFPEKGVKQPSPLACGATKAKIGDLAAMQRLLDQARINWILFGDVKFRIDSEAGTIELIIDPLGMGI